MANHPSRSATSSAPSYVILLPKVDRLWKHLGAESEAIFKRAQNAQGCINGLSGRGALEGAKVMRIIGACSRSTGDQPPEPGAIKHSGWWLIDA